MSVGVCPKKHPLTGVEIEMKSWVRKGLQLLGGAVAKLQRSTRTARPGNTMNDFPLTFQVVNQGNVVARDIPDRDALIALRSELELLLQSRAGQARLACIALSNAAAFDDPKTPDEFHNILIDALHPQLAKTIEAIDRDFPGIIGEVCQDVIAEEAATFQKDVVACLEKSTSKRVQKLSNTYALSVGLTPPSPFEDTVNLDESETAMTEQSNVPSSAIKDETNASVPTELVDTPDEQLLAESSNDELAAEPMQEFDDVEEALSAMESDLQELQAMADDDADGSTDAVEDVAQVEDGALVPHEVADLEAADATLPDESVDLETANTDAAPIDATSSAAANSDVVEEMIAQDDAPSTDSAEAEMTADTSVIDAATEIKELPQDAGNLDASSEDSNSVMAAKSDDASVSMDSATMDSATMDSAAMDSAAMDSGALESGSMETSSEETGSMEAGDDLDESALAESLAEFNEAIAEIAQDEPPATSESSTSETPSDPVAVSSSIGMQGVGTSRRPSMARSSSNRSSSTRSHSSDVEHSIGHFADFLLNQVNGMWAEARQGLDDICTVRDEIQAVRAEVSRMHQEISTMRDSVLSAKHDIRSVQSQIQNQRDDANRARQRADSAALDAQAACDRAAAAAREAESMATLSQPR